MPCFFCGKRVSLVRQLTDADFCSDEHRKRYQELTRLALDRLLDAGQRLGTPVVHADAETVPQWRPEPFAVEPRFEPGIQTTPDLRPPPAAAPQPEPEEFRSPWRPPEPEPVYAMPPVEQGEPVPPEAFYFARLDCEPQPQAFAPHAADFETFEPSFNAPTATVPPGRCGLRTSLFVRERPLRPMARTMPASSGPGGGDRFHGALHFERLTPALGCVLPHKIYQPPQQPLLVVRARPTQMAALVQAATEAAGRSVPRPALPRLRATRRSAGGVRLAALTPYPPPQGTGKVAGQSGAIGFLPFQAAAYVGWPSRTVLASTVRLSGLRPLSAAASNVPAYRSAAPAAAFAAVPSCSCHTAFRAHGVVLRGELAGVPLPRAVPRAAHPMEEPAGRFGRAAILPAFAPGPRAAIKIGGTPLLAPECSTGAPKARMVVSARRTAPMAVFDAVPAPLPGLTAASPRFGVRQAELEALGHAAASKPKLAALARAAAVDAARWPEPQASLPEFKSGGDRGALPAAASLAASGLPAPMRRAASAAASGLVAAFSAFDPSTPPASVIAAARRSLAPAAYAATSASLPSGGTRRGVVTVGPQFGRPEALIGIPALTARLRATRLSAGQPRLGIVPQRPVAVAFPPLPAGRIDFQRENRTPASSLRFEGRVGESTYFPAPFPVARKGSCSSTGASLHFAGRLASLPRFPAPAAAILLASADPATHRPAARAGRSSAAKVPEALATKAAPEVRLPDVELKLPASAGAIGPRALQGTAQPAPRVRPASARIVPAYHIDCRTLFPAPPAHVFSTHLLPAGTGLSLGPRQAKPAPAAVQAAGFSLSAPQATLIEWTSRTAAPLTLSVSAAVRGQIAGTGIRSTAQPCGWLALGPSAPAIASESGLLRPGALRSGAIERGPHLEAAPRPPAPATVLGSASPFGAREALFPTERTIAAREALEIKPAATVLPGFKAGVAPPVRFIGLGFRQRSALLPEIRIEPALARIAAGRRLDECAASALPTPARRNLTKPSAAETAVVPVPLTAPLAKAESRVRPLGPFPLGSAGLAPQPQRRAWPLDSRGRGVEVVAFQIYAPIEPASAGWAARHGLGVAAAAAGKGRTQAGAAQPAAASVVAVSTQAVELAGVRALVFAHPLLPSSFATAPVRASNRAGKPVPAGFEAYGRESSAAEFEVIQSRASGVRWPSATSFQFAPEPKRPARAGVATKADPHASVEFAPPAARQPESAGHEPLLGSASATKLAAPTARQDAATTGKTVHLEPLFRPHRHPSRLPVFHDTVEKAHMPSGVFHYVEFEDWNDERTYTCAAPCAASPLEPWIPTIASSPQARYRLGASPLGPVGAGPRPGVETPAAGFGELPFAFEVVVLASGAQLDRMDFEAIADTYEPRWRSALKSASGLFRGVLMILCVAGLGTALTGCSERSRSLKESIQSRSAVHMEHDFSKGLEGWYGAGDWAATWSHDAAGFVGAGQLALYKPSQQLSDYRFEFLGQVTGRTIGWVFRAADMQNYYATQLAITKPGPLPDVALVRYQVVGGQESERVEIPVHVGLQNGRPCRIEEDVAGSGFTTSVDGVVVDSWTDDRLRAGAVGFFGSPEDKPSLYWIKVSNNDDFWGKLCGILAPSN